jgi:sugar transferase (PEP-CTERM system associated)
MSTSTMSTSYAIPAPSPQGTRLTSKGAISAWRCGVVRADGFLWAAELLFASLATVTFATLAGSLMPAPEAVGALLILAAARAAFYAAGGGLLVAESALSFMRGMMRSLLALLVTCGLLFELSPSFLPDRELVIGLTLTSVVAFTAIRSAARALVRRRMLTEECLILGSSDKAERFFKELRSFHPEGILPATGTDQPSCLVDYAHIQQLAAHGALNRIVVAEPNLERYPELSSMLLDCKLRGLTIEDAIDSYERLSGKIWAEGLRPEWVIYSRGFARPSTYMMAKRALDILAALVLLTATLPLLALIAVAIKLESAGPALFAQERVGHHGRTFTLYKFRSMRADAEASSGPVWAGEKDNRVTPLGGFLRKCRLDELPQVWNVLRGEMSFVGPRPERPYFVSLLKEHIPFYDLRHYVQPGITGWAQVMYPYGASVEDSYQKLQYDLYYSKHMSLPFDLLILLKTVQVVLMGRGAR